MPVFLFADNARATLAAGIGPTSTSVTLAPGTGVLFPSPGANQQFALTFNDLATRLIFEVVYCTARAGDVLTILRGQEGTPARSWQIGDYCWNGPTAGQMNAVVQIPRMSDGSISPTFGATTVQGALVATGPATVAGLTNNGPAALNGNVTASGNVIVAGDTQSFSVHTTNAVVAGTNVSGSDIIASHNVTATNDISAGRNVTAGSLVSSSGSIQATLDVTATRDVLAGRDVTGARNVTATAGTVWAGTQVWANNGNVTANQGNLVASFDVTCRSVIATATVQGNFIRSTGKMQVDGDFTGVNVSVTGNVAAGYVSSTGNINAAGSFTGGNVNVSLDITGRNINATGAVAAAGNITTVADITARSHYATTQFSGPYFTSTGDMNAAGTYKGGNVKVTGTVEGAWLNSTGNINAAADLGVARDAFITRNTTVAGTITGGYITTAGNVNAANQFTGGSVAVTGAVSGGSLASSTDLSVARNSDILGTAYAGAVYSRGPVYVGNLADFYLSAGPTVRLLYYSGANLGYYWQWNTSGDNAGDLYWVRAGRPVIQLTYPRLNAQEDGDLFLYSQGAWKYGGGPFYSFSDSRLKDIGDVYTGGLAQLRQLAPRRFHYRQDMAPKDVVVPAREFIGFSVEDLEPVMPEAVVGDPKISDVRGVDTNPLLYAMLNAIKELDREVRSLQAQLASKGPAMSDQPQQDPAPIPDPPPPTPEPVEPPTPAPGEPAPGREAR